MVKSADQLGASMQRPSEEGTLTDAQVEEHHRAMNDESVVSLTDLLEAASQDEAVSRYVEAYIKKLLVCIYFLLVCIPLECNK